jgi:hypothetical protein
MLKFVARGSLMTGMNLVDYASSLSCFKISAPAAGPSRKPNRSLGAQWNRIVDRQRLMGDCCTMSNAMIDVLSVRGLLKTDLPAGEAVISRVFRFADFSPFSGWRPPRS